MKRSIFKKEEEKEALKTITMKLYNDSICVWVNDLIYYLY